MNKNKVNYPLKENQKRTIGVGKKIVPYHHILPYIGELFVFDGVVNATDIDNALTNCKEFFGIRSPIDGNYVGLKLNNPWKCAKVEWTVRREFNGWVILCFTRDYYNQCGEIIDGYEINCACLNKLNEILMHENPSKEVNVVLA